MLKTISIPSMRSHHHVGTTKIKGMGMGSVLLNKGGAGGASAYSGLEDYKDTTGRNPFKGSGVSTINNKLENLMLKNNSSKKKKDKNINFNL